MTKNALFPKSLLKMYPTAKNAKPIITHLDFSSAKVMTAINLLRSFKVFMVCTVRVKLAVVEKLLK